MSVTVNNSPIQDYIHPDGHIIPQRPKKVMSDSPWLMDFVIKLPYGQVKFFSEDIQITEDVLSVLLVQIFSD